MHRITTSARFASALATAFLAAIAIASAAPPAQSALSVQQQLQPVQIAQSDAMTYNISTQNQLCKLEQHGPTGGTYWQSTMNLNIDRLPNHSLERMWSIFQDHQHEFVICR